MKSRILAACLGAVLLIGAAPAPYVRAGTGRLGYARSCAR